MDDGYVILGIERDDEVGALCRSEEMQRNAVAGASQCQYLSGHEQLAAHDASQRRESGRLNLPWRTGASGTLTVLGGRSAKSAT